MIEARGLTKRYGSRLAVDDLNFTVRPGVVTGFLGPNGAGKTTTMRLILGLDRPTAGTVTVDGRTHRRAASPMHEVGALLGDPRVLMFDEPVNGLDPEGIVWIRTLMRSLAAEGRVVFVSSHLMSEMENTADHLIVVGKGRLVADCPMAEFIARGSGTAVLVQTPAPGVLARAVATAGGSVTSEASAAEPGWLRVHGLSEAVVGGVAFAAGVPVHHLAAAKVSLEQAFMELTADSVEYHAALPVA
jgi:ABC-2 type transport system ATP-binding protein